MSTEGFRAKLVNLTAKLHDLLIFGQQLLLVLLDEQLGGLSIRDSWHRAHRLLLRERLCHGLLSGQNRRLVHHLHLLLKSLLALLLGRQVLQSLVICIRCDLSGVGQVDSIHQL